MRSNHFPQALFPRMEQQPSSATSPLANYGRPPHASDDPHPLLPSALRRDYDAGFAVTADYQASLPDLMCRANDDALRAPVLVQQVGISGFRLPLRYRVASPNKDQSVASDHHGKRPTGAQPEKAASAGSITLDTRVSGTVALDANLRAINMSRIIRTFYEFEEEIFTLDTLPTILDRLRETVGSHSARLRLDFSFPLLQQSLRSELAGYQYYDCVFEAQLSRGEHGGDDTLRRWLRLDFVYSSACPCSSELAEHARTSRGVFAIPHSQRSRARVWVEVTPGVSLTVEDVQAACLRALQTETQVMVRRPDEQAFAELNGAHVKFVEDAARLLYRELSADARIRDFQIACSHLESLHSHDAVAVICKGLPGGYRGEFTDFAALGC